MEALIRSLAGLESWQIAGAVVLMLWQGAVFAALPEEVILIALGTMWAREKLSFPIALGVAQLGLIPADAFPMWLAHKLGNRVVTVAPFKWALKPAALAKARELVARHGTRIVFATRFIPTVRMPVYIAVGLSKMSVLRFMRTDWLASFIQITIWLCVGRWLALKS
jgi:membrane protein DedA with SNARE-associated domain